MKPTVMGHGPLVIFINGGGCGQWMWEEVINRLDGYKMITFDYDGFAGEPGVFTTMDREIEKIKQLITQEADGNPVYLVGHSLGAQIALRAASLVHKVIAISALNQPSPKLLKLSVGMGRWSLPLAKFRWFAKLNASSLGIGERLFEQYYQDSRDITVEWFTNLLIANMTFQVEKLVAGKAMIVVGEKEPRMMLDSARRLSDNPVIVPGAKHDIPFNHPELVVQWIREFCR